MHGCASQVWLENAHPGRRERPGASDFSGRSSRTHTSCAASSPLLMIRPSIRAARLRRSRRTDGDRVSFDRTRPAPSILNSRSRFERRAGAMGRRAYRSDGRVAPTASGLSRRLSPGGARHITPIRLALGPAPTPSRGGGPVMLRRGAFSARARKHLAGPRRPAALGRSIGREPIQGSGRRRREGRPSSAASATLGVVRSAGARPPALSVIWMGARARRPAPPRPPPEKTRPVPPFPHRALIPAIVRSAHGGEALAGSSKGGPSTEPKGTPSVPVLGRPASQTLSERLSAALSATLRRAGTRPFLVEVNRETLATHAARPHAVLRGEARGLPAEDRALRRSQARPASVIRSRRARPRSTPAEGSGATACRVRARA